MYIKPSFIGYLLVLSAFPSPAGCSGRDASSQQGQNTQAFLRNFVRKSPFGSDPTTRYTAAQVPGTDLTVLYLSGQVWCGSGGCTLLILKSKDIGFSIVGKVTLVRLPIRLLRSTHHGLPDIGVIIKGGGVGYSYEVALQFDGIHYSCNPTTIKRRVENRGVGDVLIDSNSSTVAL